MALLAYVLLKLIWLFQHPQQEAGDFCCLNILKARDILV
jgi:hypothetical protein